MRVVPCAPLPNLDRRTLTNDILVADHVVVADPHAGPDRVARRHVFTIPPRSLGWPTYDDRGLARVQAGRSTEAILFTEHFAPLAASLLGVD